MATVDWHSLLDIMEIRNRGKIVVKDPESLVSSSNTNAAAQKPLLELDAVATNQVRTKRRGNLTGGPAAVGDMPKRRKMFPQPVAESAPQTP